jgi:hypothetical protein
VQKIIDKCPILEHLVLWMSGDFDIIHSLSHPKIIWMDIWVELPPILNSVETFSQTNASGLSSLRRMRVFDNRLWRPRGPDLPALLPRLLSKMPSNTHILVSTSNKQAIWYFKQIKQQISSWGVPTAHPWMRRAPDSLRTLAGTACASYKHRIITYR